MRRSSETIGAIAARGLARAPRPSSSTRRRRSSPPAFAPLQLPREMDQDISLCRFRAASTSCAKRSADCMRSRSSRRQLSTTRRAHPHSRTTLARFVKTGGCPPVAASARSAKRRRRDAHERDHTTAPLRHVAPDLRHRGRGGRPRRALDLAEGAPSGRASQSR